ncbi:Acyl dehydratase [Melghirimyces thermohalophilus]|uniref:Acyl dehydratase n=1 Tax=Melghirimyces thermohalophilus TaxID=1236220 RepID=A0A1G6MQ54_9BACL|nr:Acyl dehydratase [Melghirimyces thermohalophilus]
MITEVFDLSVGQEIPSRTLPPVTRLDLIKYAGASGDYNPIHTIDEAAEKAGLPGVIAHGMLTMGRMATLFSPYLERGFIRKFTTRFKGMVFLGDEITLKAVLVDKHGDTARFDVTAVNQKGETVTAGQVEFCVRNK